MTETTARARFLDRMRAALRAWRPATPAHAPLTEVEVPIFPAAPTPPTTTAGTDDLALRFAAMLGAVGGYAHVAATLDEAVARVRLMIREKGLHEVIITRHPAMDQVAPGLTMTNVQVTQVGFAPGETPTPEARAAQREVMAQAELVVSGADYAIAETGTLAMVAGPHNPRAATLLPPLHVAIVPVARLLPAMPDLVARFKADHVRDGQVDISGLTFITGPSRTGDIEQTLSVGVHGPGEVHVILYGGM